MTGKIFGWVGNKMGMFFGGDWSNETLVMGDVFLSITIIGCGWVNYDNWVKNPCSCVGGGGASFSVFFICPFPKKRYFLDDRIAQKTLFYNFPTILFAIKSWEKW